MRTARTRRRRTAPIEVAAVLALTLTAPVALAQDAGGGTSQQETDATSRRTATEEELRELLDDFRSAERSKEYAQVAAVLVRMAGFSNEELLDAAEKGLEYRPSRKDLDSAKEEAKALGMTDKDTVKRFADVRAAEVVAAAAEVVLAVGTEDSAGLLVDAIGDKKVNTNPPAIGAVVDALARHPHLGEDADRDVKAILMTIDAHDLAGDDFPQAPVEVKGYDEVGKYSAVIRYFGARKTRDFEVALYLAKLLRAPVPESPDSPDNPPQAYWEKRHGAWMKYKRDVVWTLREITGQTWKPGHDDEGGQAVEAVDWLYRHKQDLGFE